MKHHMDDKGLLPFKVGQLAESRSFQSGFRGAWFRCKIIDISMRKGQTEYALEFFDFPDEKINWTRIYQWPPKNQKSRVMKRQLMVRPQYPPTCHESQMPCVNTISEVTVVINGEWKVGDLVDWWTDGCNWSGRVTQIFGNDKVQIELPPPPIGEGLSYEVLCKDLRPSLDWCPKNGWSVPTPKTNEILEIELSSQDIKKWESYRPCARLVEPVNQEDEAGVLKLEVNATEEGIKVVQQTTESPFDASLSSQISAHSLPPMDESKHLTMEGTPGQLSSVTIPNRRTQWLETTTELDMGDSAVGKKVWSDSASSSQVRDASSETAGHPAGDDHCYDSGSLKKMRTGGNISLNSMYSDTLDAAILDLEELVNRVKWLKRILEFGVPKFNAGRPPWKFIEHRASYTPK